MTKNEATERAKLLWPGKRPDVTAAIGKGVPAPGDTQWWIDLGNESHGLDVNGHVTCHESCKRKEESLK